MICGVSLSQAAESIAPVINITPSESNVKAGDTIIVTVSDDSGLRNVSYKWATQSTSTILTDDVTGRQSVSIEVGQLGTAAGTYSLEVVAKDIYGNRNKQDYDFIIGSTATGTVTTTDKIDPVVEANLASGKISSGSSVVLTLTDNKELYSVSYKWGSQSSYKTVTSGVNGRQSASVSAGKLIEDGTYDLDVKVTDAAGNTSTANYTYTIGTTTTNPEPAKDTTDPTISMTPDEKEIESGTVVVITAKDDTALKNVSYKWGSQSEYTVVTSSVKGEQTVKIEAGKLIEAGTYDLDVKVEDLAGNIETAEYVYIISIDDDSDDVDPEVEVSPAPGAVLGGTKITITATDNESLNAPAWSSTTRQTA